MQTYKTRDEAMEVFMAEHPETLDDDIEEAFDRWCEKNEVTIEELENDIEDIRKESEGQY